MTKLKLTTTKIFVSLLIVLVSIDAGFAQTLDQYVAQGRAKFERGDYQGSILDFNEAIKLNPNDATLYAGRGFPKAILNDFPGAIQDFNKAIELDPKNAVYYTFRANAKLSLRDGEGAIQDYNRGLVIGSQTFGKGTVQSLMPLRKGQLKATTAKYYRISGQSTQNKGVIPDLEYPDVVNDNDIGESSLPEAMAWDRINSIPYQTYYNMADLLPRLREKYKKRMKLNPHYFYVLARKKHFEEMSSRKDVSLSEAKRRQESEEADRWRLELENKLRRDFNKSLLESLDDLKENPHGNTGADDSEENEDYMQMEAAEVFVDFIELVSNEVAAQ